MGIGITMLLFMAWEIWGTDYTANSQSGQILTQIRADYEPGQPADNLDPVRAVPRATDLPGAELARETADTTTAPPPASATTETPTTQPAAQTGQPPSTTREPEPTDTGSQTVLVPDKKPETPTTQPAAQTGQPPSTTREPEPTDISSQTVLVPDKKPETPAPDRGQGDAVGIVHLPTIGETRPVLHGIAMSILDQGVLGQYDHAAEPGAVGNFAVAGHRTTHGAPLWSLGDLEPGDPIVVETDDAYFVYVFDRHRIVTPDKTEVVAPVPDDASWEQKPEEAWMVLTTCHPRYSAEQRLIAYASLDRRVDRSSGVPPEIADSGA
jgi:sortase A